MGLDSLEQLIDEFASRCREGQSPSVSDYAAKYPQHAAQIRELLPAVAMMEQLRATEQSKRDALWPRGALADPPQQLGDFQIIQEIGRGGMGVVYEAQQRSLGRSVAVKVLPRHALLPDKHLQRFHREACTAARLRHTNIVPVFGVGEQDGLHYYVMPLVRGVGLDDVIRTLRARAEAGGGRGDSAPDLCGLVRELTAKKFASQPPPGQAGDDNGSQREGPKAPRSEPCSAWHNRIAHLGVQAAEALDYAHGQGTLHRDIKPGNLLLDEEGVVSVADFGLARSMDGSDTSRSGDFVGTVRYMAPEQSRGTADARSDVYALGLTLYELLTLQPAFAVPQPEGSPRAAQAMLEPVRPTRIDRSIPRDLETIVLKCLAYEPANRYQTAAALAADLRRFLENKPVLARRASAIERTGRWCRRNPALAAMSALASVLLVAFAVTAVAGYLHTRKAYAETRRALEQSEATSHLALEVLDGIYAQLSPQRMWIASDADPGGQACACIGLRAGDDSAASVQRGALEMRASRETAMLLDDLLVFYDRLAAQDGEDSSVTRQSAVASRRVGDIRLCLGQLDRAEKEYLRAVEKLTALRAEAPADLDLDTELARSQNEIGNVRSTRREARAACESHQAALEILQSSKPESPTAEYRYELARTFYFLAGKCLSATSDARSRAADARAGRFTSPLIQSNEYRNSAIRILEGLIADNPRAPDTRLLLALCHRCSPAIPGSASGSRSAQGRLRAIEILEKLSAEYPGVADYRYELIATYAWIPVSLFPWQGRAAVSQEGEQSLHKALAESQWLIDHHPTVPHYARCRALILAKLAVACWRSHRVAEAEDFFQKAVQTQSALVAGFSDLPPHDQVLLQFLRLRLAQVALERSAGSADRSVLGTHLERLEQCIAGLAELRGKPELAGDQLAQTSLPLAYDALRETLAALGQPQKAEEARQKAKSLPPWSKRAVP